MGNALENTVTLNLVQHEKVTSQLLIVYSTLNGQDFAQLDVHGFLSKNYQLGDHFDNFLALRADLEAQEILLACKGCLKNVFPSGMSRSMSFGLTAYETDEATLETEPVCIYQPIVQNEYKDLMTYEQQVIYRKKFLEDNKARFIERNKLYEAQKAASQR